MGTGFQLSCRRCGYTLEAELGIGFRYPVVYRKILESAKAGRLGEGPQRFLEEHPDGVLNCNTVLLVCRECGCLKTGPDLSMHLPKSGEVPSVEERWPAPFRYDDVSCRLTQQTLEEDYLPAGRYQYECHKCGGMMTTVREKTLNRVFEKYGFQDPVPALACPDCEKPLYFTVFRRSE